MHYICSPFGAVKSVSFTDIIRVRPRRSFFLTGASPFFAGDLPRLRGLQVRVFGDLEALEGLLLGERARGEVAREAPFGLRGP